MKVSVKCETGGDSTKATTTTMTLYISLLGTNRFYSYTIHRILAFNLDRISISIGGVTVDNTLVQHLECNQRTIDAPRPVMVGTPVAICRGSQLSAGWT